MSIIRVSTAADGSQAASIAGSPSISADGRLVAFVSRASNLMPGDTNDANDIFVRDLHTNIITRIALPEDQYGAGQHSLNPSISGDGQFVAFTGTDASYLFVCNLQTRTITRLTNVESFFPSISGDGSFVAYDSESGSAASEWSVFVRDLLTGVNIRASVGNDGSVLNGVRKDASISANGRFVAFENRVYPGFSDISVRNLETNSTTLVSVTAEAVQVNGESSNPSISANGRSVAFESSASNLVQSDTNRYDDIFVRDLKSNATIRASVAFDGMQGDGGSSNSSISADGRFVAFESVASNLVPGDNNGRSDVFVRDLQMNVITRVSVAPDGSEANYPCKNSSISADGRFVLFESSASNLVAGDTNGQDVFRADVVFPVVVEGDDDSNSVVGSSTNEILLGFAGDDTLDGNDGDDGIVAGAGGDQLDGGLGDDDLRGGEGRDTLFGGEGDDDADGNAHRDDIDGGAGYDSLSGRGGSDTLNGGLDKDWSHGGNGDDLLEGGAGCDTLIGGIGRDTLEGGIGNDVFRYKDVAQSPSGTPDLIADFKSGSDRIDLSRVGAEAFIGGAAFSGGDGVIEVRAVATATSNRWQVDVDDDGVFGAGDREIRISAFGLAADDFILA